MIIDCHTHIFPDEVRKHREAFCQRDRGFASIYQDLRAKVIGADDLICSMDEAGISQSVICGFPWHDRALCSFHNEYLLESASRYPDRLIVFILLPLMDVEGALRELDEARKRGAKGVGEIAFYDREMTYQDLETMAPIFKKMEQEKIPVLLHTNEHLGHSYPGKGKTPLELFYQFACLYPALRILLAHWGGGLLFYELMPEVARAMGNVYYDTAASPFLYSKKIYAVAKEVVGVEKIIFGSDFPLIPPHRYFRELEESNLSLQDREKILGLNFLRFLKTE